MAEWDTDVLAELVRRKCACLTGLRDMGRRQLELIGEGDISALLDVLAVKQRWLLRLQHIEASLGPFRDQDPDERCWRSPEVRRECAEQLQECETLLVEIINQEKLSESQLARRRDEAASRLQAAHLAGRARGIYASDMGAESGQLDLLCDG